MALPTTTVSIRLRDDLIDLIDRDLPSTTFTNRSAWIQNAVREQLMKRGILDDSGALKTGGGGGKFRISESPNRIFSKPFPT